MVSRADHIAGLDVARLTPADIDYSFKTLLPRVPKRVPDHRQPVLRQLQFRLHALAVYLGDPLAPSINQRDVVNILASICERLERMKRRDWRARIAGTRVLEHLRNEIGEISADLHETSVG